MEVQGNTCQVSAHRKATHFVPLITVNPDSCRVCYKQTSHFFRPPALSTPHKQVEFAFRIIIPFTLMPLQNEISRIGESRSAVSDSLQPHELYSPWNSPGQNTGVGSLSLFQGIFPTQGQTQVSHIAGRFFTS